MPDSLRFLSWPEAVDRNCGLEPPADRGVTPNKARERWDSNACTLGWLEPAPWLLGGGPPALLLHVTSYSYPSILSEKGKGSPCKAVVNHVPDNKWRTSTEYYQSLSPTACLRGRRCLARVPSEPSISRGTETRNTN